MTEDLVRFWAIPWIVREHPIHQFEGFGGGAGNYLTQIQPRVLRHRKQFSVS